MSELEKALEEGPESTEVDPHEEQKEAARRLGWTDNREEVEAKGKRFRNYDEFLDHKELIDKLDATAKDNKNLQAAIRQIQQKGDEREREGYERALREAQQQRIEAIAENDAQKFAAAENDINKLHQEQQKVDDDLVKAANRFVERNKEWFNAKTKTNLLKKQMAKELDVELYQDYPDHDERYKEIEKIIKSEFAEAPARRDNPSKVSSSEVKGVGSSKADTSGLTDEEKEVFNVMKRTFKDYTVEQYKKDCKLKYAQTGDKK